MQPCLDSWRRRCLIIAAVFVSPVLVGDPANAGTRRHHSVHHQPAATLSRPSVHHAGRARPFATTTVRNAAGQSIRLHVHVTNHRRVAKPATAASSDKPLIVVDPGHGGRDSGAIGRSGTLEKRVTLAEARELQRILLAGGRYFVVLTRNGDSYVPLSRRLAFTNRGGVALFISLHADASPDRDARGATVYMHSGNADPQFRKFGSDQASSRAIGHALADGQKFATQPGSALLQYTMVDNLNDDVRMTEDPDQEAHFFVLANRTIPSVLLEMGFLSNRQDEIVLKNRRDLQRIARAIRDAIDDYFADLRRSSAPDT